MSKVLVTRDIGHEILAPVEAAHEMDLWDGPGPMPRQDLLARAPRVEGILSMLTDAIDAELLDHAPELVVVSQMAVGMDNVDVPACRARGVRLGHTPDVLTDTVADTAFALLAAVARRLPEGERAVRDGHLGDWDPDFLVGADIHGATLGIIGLGRVGRAVARRANGFDMEVVYFSPRPVDEAGVEQVTISELLARSDFVVLSAPLTGETRGLIGEEELRSMKPGSHLINVARGGLVVTDALVEALSQGWIGGAGLDVTDPEPLPSGHPLLGLENCLVVPHIGSASTRTRRAMASLAVSNLIAALAGEPMPAEYSG